MLVKRAFKTELDLNNAQKTACVKYAGAARFVYNWALEQKIKAYKETGKTLSYIDLSRELTQLKKGEFAWLKKTESTMLIQKLIDLDEAYKRFFRRLKNGDKRKGYPKFKSKKKGLGTFKFTSSTLTVYERAIRIPKLGALKLKESNYLPVGARITQATISEKNGRWYVSVLAEVEVTEPEFDSSKPAVGVDLGIKTLATLSNGQVIENPKHLKKAEKKLARLQRSLSRKVKGSGRREDARNKVAKLYERISNKRKDAIHKFTTALTRESSVIGLEDLSVSGMLRNHKLAQAIQDASFYEIRRQIEYKAERYGAKVVVIDRFAPTSKTCSDCGCKKDSLSLSERVFVCSDCGLEIDRDLNAALNIKTLAVSYTDK